MEPFPLESHGARLEAFLLPPRAGRPLIVMCHGFPGRHFNDPVARALNARSYGALLFRYRGAFGSDGKYSMRGNEEDIRAAIAAARPHAPDGIGLLGYSMGGLHATRVLAEDPTLARFLVLQAPVTHVRKLRERIAEQAWNALFEDARGLLQAEPEALLAEAAAFREDEEPVALAPRIRAPTIIVHGAKDDEVPPEQGRDLMAALAGPREMVELPTDHYFAGLDEPLADAVDGFLRRHGI